MHVIKLVDLVARNPKHLSFHFLIFLRFLVEFTISHQQFENKLNIADVSLGFAENTLGRIGASQIGPWPDLKTGEGTGRAAPSAAGDRGWRS